MDKFLISSNNYDFILSNILFLKQNGVSKIYLRDKNLSLDILDKFLSLSDIEIFINHIPYLLSRHTNIHLKSYELDLANDLANYKLSYSAHSLNDIFKAYEKNIDYIFISPIFFVEGKNKPLGVDFLKQIPNHIRSRIFALGGINNSNLQVFDNFNIAGIAGIRMFL